MEALIILMEDPAIPTEVSKDSPDTTPDTMDMDTDMVSTSVKLMLRLMLTTVMEAMVAHLMFLSPDLCTPMDME